MADDDINPVAGTESAQEKIKQAPQEIKNKESWKRLTASVQAYAIQGGNESNKTNKDAFYTDMEGFVKECLIEGKAPEEIKSYVTLAISEVRDSDELGEKEKKEDRDSKLNTLQNSYVEKTFERFERYHAAIQNPQQPSEEDFEKLRESFKQAALTHAKEAHSKYNETKADFHKKLDAMIEGCLNSGMNPQQIRETITASLRELNTPELAEEKEYAPGRITTMEKWAGKEIDKVADYYDIIRKDQKTMLPAIAEKGLVKAPENTGELQNGELNQTEQNVVAAMKAAHDPESGKVFLSAMRELANEYKQGGLTDDAAIAKLNAFLQEQMSLAEKDGSLTTKAIEDFKLLNQQFKLRNQQQQMAMASTPLALNPGVEDVEYVEVIEDSKEEKNVQAPEENAEGYFSEAPLAEGPKEHEPEANGDLEDELWRLSWKTKFMSFEHDAENPEENFLFTKCKPDTITRFSTDPLAYSMNLKSGSRLINSNKGINLTHDGEEVSPFDAMTAVRLGKEKGWERAKIDPKASLPFKKQMYIAMIAQGIAVANIEELGFDEKMLQDLNEKAEALKPATDVVRAENMDQRYENLVKARDEIMDMKDPVKAFENTDAETYQKIRAKAEESAEKTNQKTENGNKLPVDNTPVSIDDKVNNPEAKALPQGQEQLILLPQNAESLQEQSTTQENPTTPQPKALPAKTEEKASGGNKGVSSLNTQAAEKAKQGEPEHKSVSSLNTQAVEGAKQTQRFLPAVITPVHSR